MTAIHEIPEVVSLDARRGLIRIPPEQDVPLTPRVRRLIDTAAFRRLGQISQLGLVSLVYPAALHTRFEHSLGVYRLALLYLKHLGYDSRFTAAVDTHSAEVFLVAALLHDLGHWPFCHPIEDIRLPQVPKHEAFAARYLHDAEITELLHEQWQIDPAEVQSLLTEPQQTTGLQILSSMLSGPIDIDKMDYLGRDSLHAGVPYGRHFDQGRLIAGLCLNETGNGLAITDKAKTAAELMVFARYVMFSEVYWHHGVRSATAMLQRAFYLLHERLHLESLFMLAEQPMIAHMRNLAGNEPAGELLDGLFGRHRSLYKRLGQFSYFEQQDVYSQIARRPYPWLARCAEAFAHLASQRVGTEIHPHEILFDAPPVELEVQFNVQIHFPKEHRFRRLEDVSPVVRTLAREQFDDYVKRVRVFAHPRAAALLRDRDDIGKLVIAAAAEVDQADAAK